MLRPALADILGLSTPGTGSSELPPPAAIRGAQKSIAMHLKTTLRWLCFGSLLLVASAAWSDSADGPAAEPTIDFARQILPILSDKCFVCHGPDAKQDTELRLDSFAAATADLGGHRAIDPDAPSESSLLTRIHSTDDPMPPLDANKPLSDAERELLSRWVGQGGAFANHWAFVTPQKPDIQPAADQSPIDFFVTQKLQAAGLSLAPAADPGTLARRAALTLTGLPPEPQQLAEYLADPSEQAYLRLVDQLLASPRFGEHQARYWLDAVRYGDTHGLHLDNRRGIYPYRDWVVRAFNENLPLDDFITWQLAGDLLPSPTLAQQVATGFVRMNPSTGEGGAISEEFQMKNNFDRVETFGTVFLGMTFNCVRCHTHKYDPILHTEYYRLLAFFNNTAEPALDGNSYTYGPTAQVPADQQQWDQWNQLTARRQQLPADESQLSDEQRQQAAELKAQIEALQANFTTSLIAQELPQPRTTRLLNRGEYNLPTGDPLDPGTPAVMNPFPDQAPRNRLGLAQWLTSPENPLVTRVLTNRIWQRTFGSGLVRTPEDFGLQGQQPTHPELLDWLAVELRESGWDLKHLLRLLVTSQTFRQHSAVRSDVDDPENRLLARGPRYRLDAEVLRDMGLWASELLDPQMGGEGVKPYQPSGMWVAMAHPASNTKNYQRDHGAKLYRRSLYVYWKRTSPHPMMTLFDAPDRESSCVRRSRTSTAVQSLGMLNETQRIEMGRKLAERLLRSRETDVDRLAMLFQLLACRQPTAAESTACLDLLGTLTQRYTAQQDAASQLLAIGDIARDESLPLIPQAAWTQVCVTVLASDIAIMLY